MVNRLIEFKAQLNRIDKYVNFNEPGALLFNKPVLKLPDIQYMTGVEPSDVIIESNEHIAIYDFIRTDEPNYSFRYQLVFENELLLMIDYPDIFFKFISTSFTMHALKAIGNAAVPKSYSNWNIESGSITSNVKMPTKDDIVSVFGPPSSVDLFPTSEYILYDYYHPTQSTPQKVSVAFLFSRVDHTIQTFYLKLPGRNWTLDLTR